MYKPSGQAENLASTGRRGPYAIERPALRHGSGGTIETEPSSGRHAPATGPRTLLSHSALASLINSAGPSGPALLFWKARASGTGRYRVLDVTRCGGWSRYRKAG